MGTGGRHDEWIRPLRRWEHSVTLHSTESMTGLLVDGNPARVVVRTNEIQIDCTTITREAVARLQGLFDKHFPNGKEGVVQCTDFYVAK